MIDETAREAREIVAAAEAYVREVARKSHRTPRQVEPLVLAALATLLDWAGGQAERPPIPSAWEVAARHAEGAEAALARDGLDAWKTVRAIRNFLVHHAPATDPGPLSVDLVATIAGAGLVLAEAKAALDRPAPPEGEATPLRELERENLLRVFDGWQELLGRSVGGPELAGRLGVSRQRLNALRKEGRLLGLKAPIRRELQYPTWQFGSDGRPLEALPRLLAAAREAGLDPADLDALMVSPTAGEGRPLIDHLRAGDEALVLGVIRAAGE
jgi:hypothetical protein